MAFEVALDTMIVFFLVLAVGYVAAKFGIIAEKTMPNLAEIVTKVLLPAQIFFATYVGTTRQMIIDNLSMIAVSAVFYLAVGTLAFLISKAMRLPHDKDRVFMLCFVFGNTGFVGIPLLSTMLPDSGLLYLTLFSIVDQALFWTFGIWLATARGKDAHFHAKSILSPTLVAMALVFAFVLLDIPLPRLVSDALETVKNATSAVCMMYLGAMLFFSNWRGVLKSPELYVGIAAKMVAFPVAVSFALSALGFPREMVAATTMIASLPVMTVVPMVAKHHGTEGEYATGITGVTLVACVATIPLVAFFTQ